MAQPSTFGERLAYARWWRAGMVRREAESEFAKRLGISQPALSQWRERDDPVDADKCETLARLCQVPFDWLVRGERAAVPAPEHFTSFLPVYRDWVKRGGLKRAPTKAARKTSVEEIEAEQRRRGRRAAG